MLKNNLPQICLSMRKTLEALIIFINCWNNVESIPQDFCKLKRSVGAVLEAIKSEQGQIDPECSR